jgi:glycerophosphoryl diester phosphodiesterase
MMSQLPIERARKRSLKGLRYIIPAVIAVLLIINFFPVTKINEKPFFKNNRPLVFAHQGGELLTPSNTIAAFTKAADMGVDILDTDLHITKDGYLVAIHDPTVDRTTNGHGKISEMTLSEIQRLDAGFHFKDLNGNYSYRGKGAYIPTAEELFQKFGDFRWSMEIKDDNPPGRYKEMARKLWALIQKYHMEDKIIISSFDQTILSTFNQYAKGRVAVSAGRQEVTKFVIFHKFFLRDLYQPQTDAFQIPTDNSGFDLTDQKLIDGAHRRGMNVIYWTIDDPKTMKKLIDSGADGIQTNRPDLLINLLKKNNPPFGRLFIL